jgi:hypothetical protein
MILSKIDNIVISFMTINFSGPERLTERRFTDNQLTESLIDRTPIDRTLIDRINFKN